jgi:putative transposase
MGQHQKYIVHLTDDERSLLEKHTKSGQWRPREVQRARILLLADINGPHAMQDSDISQQVGCSIQAILYRRKRFAQTQSIEDTIFDNPRSGRPTIVDGATEAHITMIACTTPPEGHAKWSLNLIRDRVVTLRVIDGLSPSTVGRVLKKKSSNHG